MRLWHTLTLEQIYSALDTSAKGLSETEAARRLRQFGPNEPLTKKESLWKVIIEPFRSIFIAVLMVAVLVSVLSHEVLDASIIAAIIIVNAIIYYTQYYATGRVLRSLKRHNLQNVQVLRGGRMQTVSSVQLVPGDIVELSEGQRVPADARVISSEHLQVNESSLTGESLPVAKHHAVLSEQAQVYERHNMVFQGTHVLTGTAVVIVVETGSRTEFGAIAEMASQEETKSPVQQKIDDIINKMVRVIGLVALLVFLLGLARGIPANEALRFVLSLTVSAVPEGLPVALTVIIVLGMRRMAKKQALVRNFKAIEDIGLVTSIATDKTGTLTKNHLSVVDTWALEPRVDMKTVIAKTIGDHESVVDPLDRALGEFSVNIHHGKAVQEYSFDQGLRMSAAFWREREGGVLYIKGAPEHILDHSNLTAEQRHAALSQLAHYTTNGYRAIAVAKLAPEKPPKDLSILAKTKLTLLGLVACADELRPEVVPAIQSARQAGISVRLITGDHYETAFHIARLIGIAEHKDQVVASVDLPKEPAMLTEAIKTKTAFARVLPEDKFRILTALKGTDIVAMTGDGVNDVPALANAHVGIAMGSGSDIAKDAGGIVLLNDNFATIVSAISEGRIIYDNIRRMLFYLLATSLGEMVTMICALLFGLPLPVAAIQILWINLVTDTCLVIPLGLERAEDGHMLRPPRRPNQPILNSLLISRLIAVALAMAGVTLMVVWILRDRGYSTPYIQTVTFMTLIAAQWANAYNARSERQSLFKRLRHPNHPMTVGLVIAFFLQALVMFGPLRQAFNIQTVAPHHLLLSVVIVTLAVLGVVEAHKFWLRNRE